MSSRVRTNSQGKRSLNGWDSARGDSSTVQWSSQSYSLKDIPQQFNLPQVVRCNPQILLTKRQQPLPVNLGQPILFYKTRTIRKLLARNVLFDTRVERFGETDETVVIPEDYEGNFLRLKSRTARDKDVHKSIESLVSNKVPAFINLSRISAFQIGKDQGSNQYPRLNYSAGNVFIIDRIFKGSTTRADASAIEEVRPSRQELHYLKCRDERDIDVLIPMSHPGEFMEVLPNPNGKVKLSMQSSDIIATQKFPTLIRYVYGGTRPRLTSYSGLFTALDSFDETSLVGCVLSSSGFTLIEMPISSPLAFQIALNNNIFNASVIKQAVKLCHQKCAYFAADMKFKFKFALRIMENSPESLCVNDEDDPPSVTNSARFGISHTYIYL
ncbi:uncharacterized protein LOC126828811 [Patella vulgata]|uniref:uncharacterized protein LOC126828811 n=1 Tax=Patella vulgata TaxID=6465 RepID=UPI00217FE204|nr:uncharacterized protein LOC126828811 [Patella vulgata]